jgi:hypothetical protein
MEEVAGRTGRPRSSWGARLGLEEGIYHQVCFHAQQCVEKCLKALLAKEGGLVPRTHKVDDLWRALPESAREAFASLQDELLELDQYYTVTRYPDAAAGRRPQGVPDGGATPRPPCGPRGGLLARRGKCSVGGESGSGP